MKELDVCWTRFTTTREITREVLLRNGGFAESADVALDWTRSTAQSQSVRRLPGPGTATGGGLQATGVHQFGFVIRSRGGRR